LTQTKLKYWLNPYDDKVTEQVFYFIEQKLTPSLSSKNKVTFKQIKEAFKDIPPSMLFDIVKFIVQQQGYYLYFSTYFKDWTIRRSVPLSKSEKVFWKAVNEKGDTEND
jgi:hypothetical protein